MDSDKDHVIPKFDAIITSYEWCMRDASVLSKFEWEVSREEGKGRFSKVERRLKKTTKGTKKGREEGRKLYIYDLRRV